MSKMGPRLIECPCCHYHVHKSVLGYRIKAWEDAQKALNDENASLKQMVADLKVQLTDGTACPESRTNGVLGDLGQ